MNQIWARTLRRVIPMWWRDWRAEIPQFLGLPRCLAIETPQGVPCGDQKEGMGFWRNRGYTLGCHRKASDFFTCRGQSSGVIGGGGIIGRGGIIGGDGR
jgi:hypothetical protein